MAVKGEPSYAELVYDVVQSADRPLTFQEIVDAVGQRRRVSTKNPKATIRGALTSARQIISDGHGHYDYLPRMISGSLVRLPLAEKKPANHPLVYTDEVMHGLWPSFFESERRQNREPVPVRLPDGTQTALALDHTGGTGWGCAMPEPLRAYLVRERAQADDALLIRIYHGEGRSCEIQFEAARRRDADAVATRNRELADAAERFLKERRASTTPMWDLVIALLARGVYRADVAPDSLEDVLDEDERFTPAGLRGWLLTASLTPGMVAEIEMRNRAEDRLLSIVSGQANLDDDDDDLDEFDDEDMFPPLPFPVGGGSPLESVFSDIQRLLNDRQVSSVEEAQGVLDELLATGDSIGLPFGAGGPGRGPAETPLDRAQEVMYEAWTQTSPKNREQLARRALEISPDCADAYVLLGNEVAETPEEAAEWYAKGVAAGERALGPEMFTDEAGYFWGLVETRPYMRARLGLAEALWVQGRQREAIEHLQDMLRLNPGDNQGVRYQLLAWLLDTDDNATAERLITQYEEDAGASWTYGAALVGFRLHGDTPATRKLRTTALETNRHVPKYLTGQKRLPAQPPEFVGFGDESEAIMSAFEQITLWQATPGALAWLGGTTRRGKR